jgi:hypothetical protein
MTIETVVIPIFCAVLSALTLWFIIDTKGHWGVKASVMTIVSMLCFVLWMSVEAMLGWPIDKTPSGEYDIVGVDIQEPNPSKDRKGGIYILIKNFEDEQKHDYLRQEEKHKVRLEPRLYKLPYSRELHKQMRNVKKALGQGARIRAEIKPKDGKKGKKGGPEYEEPEIKMYLLPPPKPLKPPLRGPK